MNDRLEYRRSLGLPKNLYDEGSFDPDYLLGVIRAIELNVDGLNTKGFQQRKETQAALDRIKGLCRSAFS